jgi:tetratricopeptide (TPR) repeat protein
MSRTRSASAHDFAGALVLAQNEDFAVIDRRALREAGVGRIRVMTSGLYAARFLAGKEKADQNPAPDIVLVHQQLADMSGDEFTALARSHPRLAGLPILRVGAGDTAEEKLAALSLGYSALLVRPYSGEGMSRALEHAERFREAREALDLGGALLNTELFDKALERFEAVLEICRREEPEQAFHKGLEQLRQREWDAAIHSFRSALRRLALRGEAEFGIALAWKGKGDHGAYRRYLERAGQSFARAAKWHRARVAYAALLRGDREAQSPFLLEAERLIRAGLFEEAATALVEGYDLTPKDPLRERLARTLLYGSDDPEKDAEALRCSLREKAPRVAESLAGEVRGEMDEQKRRMGERRREAGGTGLFPLGVPLAGEEAENAPPDFGPASDPEERGGAFPPLSEKDVGTSLFSGRPGVNEAITVAKLTWKLFRSGKL